MSAFALDQIVHCPRARLRAGVSLAGLAVAAFAIPNAAAQAVTPNIVSACSGVSLPRSVVTGILSPVVTGIVGPVQGTVNPILGTVGALLPLVPPLNIDATTLLANAAAGAPITLQVLNANGTIVGPADRCDLQADSFGLNTQGGIAIGGNRITGLGTNGLGATAGEAGSIAFGNSATTTAGATNAVAIGTGAGVTAANSVAIGAGSRAGRGALTGYTALGLAAPQTSAGEFSVGAAGAERQITNVAAGTAPSDAATVGQVTGVAAQVTALGNTAVQYDSTSKTVVTLAGTGGTTISNVAAGVAPTDAATVGQVAGVAAQVAALGNSAVQYDGADKTVVTLAGAGGTTITNVKAGAVSATSSDAVNGAQLNATNQTVASNGTAITNNSTAITNLSTAVSNGAVGPVQYSNAATPTTPNGGTPTNSLTLVGGAAGAVTLHNVAAGAVAPGSTDAVNGGQVYALGQNAVNAVTYDTTTAGVRTNRVTLTGGNTAAPVTLGNVAAGTLSATSTDAVNGAQLNATNQVVATVQSTANTALTLGQNSVQYDSTRTSVTLNSGGAASTIHNVGPGTSATDAVNVSQLNTSMNSAVTQSNSYTDARIAAVNFDLRRLQKDSYAGTAGALAAAGLPQAYEAGKGMIAISGGVYMDASAVAVGFSKAFNDGHTVVKMAGSYDSRSRAGASGGIGYQF